MYILDPTCVDLCFNIFFWVASWMTSWFCLITVWWCKSFTCDLQSFIFKRINNSAYAWRKKSFQWSMRKFAWFIAHCGISPAGSQKCVNAVQQSSVENRLCTVIVPFWFSTEHHWIVIMPLWLLADDIHFIMLLHCGVHLFSMYMYYARTACKHAFSKKPESGKIRSFSFLKGWNINAEEPFSPSSNPLIRSPAISVIPTFNVTVPDRYGPPLDVRYAH